MINTDKMLAYIFIEKVLTTVIYNIEITSNVRSDGYTPQLEINYITKDIYVI